jgi:DNA-binding transcriptional ArsR family regulator
MILTDSPAPPLDDAELDLVFGALADPTRRSILVHLTERDATGVELAVPFEMSQQAIAKHLKVLETAGLITRTRTARSRTCRLEPGRLDDAIEWIARHRQMWADRYDRLDQHLQTLRSNPTASSKEQQP